MENEAANIASENKSCGVNPPAEWLVPEATSLPYNPFLQYPQITEDQRREHQKGTPWLSKEDVEQKIGFIPDAVFCFTGSIKQPWVDKSGNLHAPLEGDKKLDQAGATPVPDSEGYVRSQNLRGNFPYGAASFAMGEDPYRKDIQGTGGKVNVIATKHICDALPQDLPVYTAATFSNDLERRMAAEQNMPTAAGIYEYELRRFGVENPIYKLDQEDATNSLEMIVQTLKEVHAHPEYKDVAAVTLRYHVPRAEAFLNVCGMGEDGKIQDWIFDNLKAKTGKDILTPEFRQMIDDLQKRGVKYRMVGAEDIMDQVDLNKIAAGEEPHYGSVLRLIYPPKLSTRQFETMSPEQKLEWINRVDNLKVRLDTEARGVSQIKDKTYWAPKK